MTVVIHQPEHLPWLAFFDKIAQSDLFVVLDNVQYQHGFMNRNKIKTPDGWQWIIVPIEHQDHRKLINQVRIHNETDWRKQNWLAIKHNYSRAPCFKKYSSFFEKVYQKEWTLLAELNVYLIKAVMTILGLETPLVMASSLKAEGKATYLMVNICQETGADVYLTGKGSKDYIKEELFLEKGIKVAYQEFKEPKYKQLWDDFIPNLSVIDFLFNYQSSKLKQITK